MELNYLNTHINKFLNTDDLMNVQKTYSFFYKVLLFGTLIGLISALISIVGVVETTSIDSTGNSTTTYSSLIGLSDWTFKYLYILGWVFNIIISFSVGSLVLFLENKRLKAILFGIGFIIISLLIYFIDRNILNVSQLSNTEKGITQLFVLPFLFLIFYFIHGLVRGNVKTGLYASLGFIVAYIFNNLLINTGLAFFGYAFNIKQLFLSNIFQVAITWYFVLLFESISYNENYRKVFRRLFEVSRRLDRRNYIIAYMFAFIPSFFIGFSIHEISEGINSLVILVLCLPLAFLGIISVFQAIKRIHDINKSGWWLLVPVWNIYLVFFKKGDKNTNTFGPPLYL